MRCEDVILTLWLVDLCWNALEVLSWRTKALSTISAISVLTVSLPSLVRSSGDAAPPSVSRSTIALSPVRSHQSFTRTSPKLHQSVTRAPLAHPQLRASPLEVVTQVPVCGRQGVFAVSHERYPTTALTTVTKTDGGVLDGSFGTVRDVPDAMASSEIRCVS